MAQHSTDTSSLKHNDMDSTTQSAEQNDAAVVKFSGPKDVLIAARKLIEKPENWIKGAFDNDNGCFCSLGALLEVTVHDGDYFDAASDHLRLQTDGAITLFNDTRTHAEVLAAFDRAIAKAGAA